MANIHREVQAKLDQHPDAVECAACNLLYMPEKYDGQLIVNVVRVEGDPPGMPGVPLCDDCLQQFLTSNQISRDGIELRLSASMDVPGPVH